MDNDRAVSPPLRPEIKRVFDYKDFGCVDVKRGFVLFLDVREHLCRGDRAGVSAPVSVGCAALVPECPHAAA
jgi:hypothetical protein